MKGAKSPQRANSWAEELRKNVPSTGSERFSAWGFSSHSFAFLPTPPDDQTSGRFLRWAAIGQRSCKFSASNFYPQIYPQRTVPTVPFSDLAAPERT